MSKLSSIIYKLVLNNRIIAEGSKRDMQRLAKTKPGSFVGIGGPYPAIGRQWQKPVE